MPRQRRHLDRVHLLARSLRLGQVEAAGIKTAHGHAPAGVYPSRSLCHLPHVYICSTAVYSQWYLGIGLVAGGLPSIGIDDNYTDEGPLTVRDTDSWLGLKRTPSLES